LSTSSTRITGFETCLALRVQQPIFLKGQSNPSNMAVCQDLVPLVNIKIAGKWMFIPLKMVLIGIDPYPYRKGNYF